MQNVCAVKKGGTVLNLLLVLVLISHGFLVFTVTLDLTAWGRLHESWWYHQLLYRSFIVRLTSKDDVPTVSPLSGRIEELWVVCGLYIERWSYKWKHGEMMNNLRAN